MAEEFVIRVQVENLQGRGAAPRTGSAGEQNRGSSTTNQSLSASEIDAARLSLKEEIPRLGSQGGYNWTARQPDGKEIPLHYRNFSERFTKKDLVDGQKIHKEAFVPGSGFKERRASIREADGSIVNEAQQQTIIGATSEGIHNHRARIRASLTIATNSVIRAAISTRAHRSGDSYNNEIIQQAASATSSLASIGIAQAIWGPTAAIAFAANFAISTGATMYVENSNFKFDRKMDTLYVHNVSQVAGDISYGRRGER